MSLQLSPFQRGCPLERRALLLAAHYFYICLSSAWNRFSGKQRDWVLKVLKVHLKRRSLKSNNLCLHLVENQVVHLSECPFFCLYWFIVNTMQTTHGVNMSLMTSVNMRNDYRKQNLVETGRGPVRSRKKTTECFSFSTCRRAMDRRQWKL